MDRTSLRSSRPLSPHLQIYRWYLTMALSILHRVTGVGLTLGTLVFFYWLISLATGPQAYETALSLLGSWFGLLLLLGWTFALYFHLCNGIRHLYWDSGRGMEIHQAYRSGVLVIVATLALTAATWLIAFL